MSRVFHPHSLVSYNRFPQSSNEFNFGIVHRFPKLRLLDFRKIRQKDRQAALELFRSKQGKELLKEIAKKAKASAENPSAADSNPKGNKYTFFVQFDVFKTETSLFNAAPTANPEDVQKIREAIKNATSLQEVERLTRLLKSGSIPDNFNANENGNGNGKKTIRSFLLFMQSKLIDAEFHFLRYGTRRTRHGNVEIQVVKDKTKDNQFHRVKQHKFSEVCLKISFALHLVGKSMISYS